MIYTLIFNRHKIFNWHRRVNLILYLNKGWNKEYGGFLELWNRDMTKSVTKISPSFNVMSIFKTDEFSFHGHPDPLKCPEDVTRKSIALYYYTESPPENLAAPHSTCYVKRPRDETNEEIEELRAKRSGKKTGGFKIMKSILITGCAGFIGSHAVDLFLQKKYNIIGVDCMTYAARMSNLDRSIKNENFKFYEKDICNTDFITSLCSDNLIEWIINFAAETHVDNSIKSSDRFIHSNISGVKSLLETCRKTSAKIFQISTDEVYGSIASGSFKETSRLNPKNPYAATKAAAEHLVTSYSNTHDIDYKMVRMSNNFGPRQHSEKFIPTIINSISSGKKIPIYGDGKNVRDWFYVRDCVKMVARVLEFGHNCQAYNLTHNHEITNLEIVKKICDEMGADFKKFYRVC